MTVWEKFEHEQKEEYIKFLKVYGALSNLFRQKHGDEIPYLDSKFQETVFARVFDGENVDIGNTPHDVLKVFGNERIGIGLKTWMNSTPSFQKVMQLKRYKDEITDVISKNNLEDLAFLLSNIKNDRMRQDYERLGLSTESNIYHYITRDNGKFVIQECSYPLINVNNLQEFNVNNSSFNWSDGVKKYKFTFADSQIWQHFDSNKYNTHILSEFRVDIMDDPFQFLMEAYFGYLSDSKDIEISTDEYEVAYLPLYSYRSKKVEEKSGLNAWNAASKNKGSNLLRPLNEIYIPIPREFHRKYPDFFVRNIFEFEDIQKRYNGPKNDKPQVRFHLNLPNGKRIPALVTQENMKGLQSGSNYERDENGNLFGQAALGQWLLVDVLGLKSRELVTLDWLEKRGTDSVKIWRKKDDYEEFFIDFAPIGAFEAFMSDKGVSDEEDDNV